MQQIIISHLFKDGCKMLDSLVYFYFSQALDEGFEGVNSFL